MIYQFALFLVAKDHAWWGFVGKRVENLTAVRFQQLRGVAFLFLELSDRRWGLPGEVCQNDRAFILSVFRRFFAFSKKTRKNAFWGGNLKIILRSGDVCVEMTGSWNWIFEIRWGLPIFGEVYHTMRFYDKRWGFDHPMRFMIRWCFRWGLTLKSG